MLLLFPRWQPAAILGLIEPEIAPFDPPTLKTYPRTKHEVDRMTCCGDMALAIQSSTPILREREGRCRGSSVVPLERAMVVSYMLPIVTRGAVVPERNVVPFRQIFLSRNGAPVNTAYHSRNADTAAFCKISSY